MRTAFLIALLVLGWVAIRTDGFAHTPPAITGPALTAAPSAAPGHTSNPAAQPAP